ncbi:RCC1 domain-containing protein 1 [Drosophila mojavensis]|uniref:RCC1 domain-containing protein 1 n=1 Tax=Drosophila mojavensis TaxID=7230 RepID=B4KAP1_DROMO|nr:RCC1 domain-containing protein 1 [Drosophila mojavensis]EDW16778.1 uncharacterized protein Dmoj_GI10720 [Drosophila mojavensis]
MGRRLLFTGFNAFGQHNASSTERTSGRVNALTEISLSDDSDGKIILALSWRYTAYAVGKKLWLQGLLASKPAERLEVHASEEIKALAACDAHCLVLLQSGQLYKLRAELNATLQAVKLEAPSAKRNIFGQAKEAEDISITHIACGSHINVAITAGNAVYSIPSCLHRFPQGSWRVRQLECGHEHALLLNGNGDVYSWGNGLRGQLGHESLGVEERPLLLEPLAGIKITHIAAGGWHSAAISAFGDLYVWGWNCNGQLGMRVMKPDGLLKEPTVYPLPQLQDLPACCAAVEAETDVCTPIKAYAGSRHTLIQRSCGRLWACGWCAHGQLGQQPPKLAYLDSFNAMQQLPKDCDYNVVCGPWSTLIALSE